MDEMKAIRLDDSKPEMNCGIVLPILDTYRARSLPDAYQRFIERIGIPDPYLRNHHNWISYAAYNRILDVLTEEAGDEDAVFKIVREGTKGMSMGPLKVIGMPVLSIPNFYRMTVLYQRAYAKLADWEIRELKAGHAVLALRYDKGYSQTRRNCDAVRGFLAGLPQWADQRPATVRHVQCAVNGADCCLYDPSSTVSKTHMLVINDLRSRQEFLPTHFRCLDGWVTVP